MSSLEELLYQAVTGNANIQTKLAKYGTNPAFFEGVAPEDTDKGWTGKQYPRVNYAVDRQEDVERKVSGTVFMEIWSTSDENVTPEEVEADLKAILDGAVFHPADEPVSALKWSRSEPFSQETRQNQKDGIVIGVVLGFDLLAFPAQTTNEPDPVAAINNWNINMFNNLQVDPETWGPTNNTPAIYWRLSGLTMVSQTNSVIWMDAQLSGHIITNSTSTRLQWLKTLVEELTRTRRIKMGDGSPMFIQRISADSSADPFREGQMRVTARYGILYKEQTYEPLNNAVTSGALT